MARKSLEPAREVCLVLPDQSRSVYDAAKLFGIVQGSNSPAQSARLSEQFIAQNRRLFATLEVTARRDYDGKNVLLLLESQNAIGAVPLLSPLTFKADLGLVVKPRFEWGGIGPMLADMGWLIVPSLLRLPLLRRSERRLPAWVLSAIILTRLRALLDHLERRFEISRETLRAPKGTIHWDAYATRSLPRAAFLDVPCTFVDLKDDRLLKSAVRFTVEKQLRSLETQREQGSFIHRLIAFAESLLQRVSMVPSRRPHDLELGAWNRYPLRSEAFLDGLQAMEWTVEDRGLAGLSDLEGIPWTMPMDRFFEAWVETVFRRVIQRAGGTIKAGRKRETVAPISWEPPFLGSQKSLVPDLILELGGRTIIVDAKYKRHWEEFADRAWHQQSAELREQHRADLLQVLAYSSLSASPDVVCCLVYPCTVKTWESLKARGRLFHRAALPFHGRDVKVWLTAVPMSADLDQVATPLIHQMKLAA